MNRFKSLVLIVLATLATASGVMAQDRYYRRLELPVRNGEKSAPEKMLIGVVKTAKGNQVVEGIFDKSSDTTAQVHYYLLFNGVLMPTQAKDNANMLFDTDTLPFDKTSNISNTRLYSNYDKKVTPTQVIEANNDALQATLTFFRIAEKYMDNSQLSADKDTIVNVRDSCFFLDVKGEALPFFLVVNDTTQVTNKELFKTGTPINLTDASLMEKLRLPKFDVTTECTMDIPRIQLIAKGHIPSYIKKVDVKIVEKRCVPVPSDGNAPTFIQKYLIWIILCVLVLAAVAVLLFLYFKKKKNKETDHDSDSGPKDYEDKDDEQVQMPLVGNVASVPTRDESGDGGEKGIDDFRREVSRLTNELRQRESELDAKKDKITRLEKEKTELSESLEKETSERKQKVEEARADERKRTEKKIEDLTDEKRRLNDALEQEKKDSKRREADARDDERKKAEKKINDLTEEKRKLSDALEQEKKDSKRREADARDEERKKAETAIADLKKDHAATVKRLEDDQKAYSEKIAFVPFATQYAKDIYSLIEVVNQINGEAVELAKTDVEDPYLIFKAISRYNMAQSKIDYESFLLDVSLAAKNNMTFTNSGINNLRTVSQDQVFTSLRSYFLMNYLEKYINAAVVYNESLAGMDRLVPGVTAAQTASFKQYRSKLLECCKQLGIAVVSVKLFDTLGDNVDLKAKMVDYDENIPSESIIGIENCLVYAEGGRRPQEKIYVTAQK